MYELEGMDENDQNWNARLKELRYVITYHVDDDENEMFEKYRNILSQKKAQEIAQQYHEFKKGYKGEVEAGEFLT